MTYALITQQQWCDDPNTRLSLSANSLLWSFVNPDFFVEQCVVCRIVQCLYCVSTVVHCIYHGTV